MALTAKLGGPRGMLICFSFSEQGEEWKWEQDVHTTQTSGWPVRQGSAE